jgi:hypothetical protein
MLHTGKRLPTRKLPTGQADLTGTDGLASEHPALNCPSPHSPYTHPKPGRVSPNALFPPPDHPTTGRPVRRNSTC